MSELSASGSVYSSYSSRPSLGLPFGGGMFLRHSNAKLQEELRDTAKAYTEEKSVLRAHLANLRWDVSDLHTDALTTTTTTTTTADNDAASCRSLGYDYNDGNDTDTVSSIKGGGGKKKTLKALKEKKNLRFMSRGNTGIVMPQTEKKEVGTEKEESPAAQSFWNVDDAEQQKFAELQKNQDVMRSIRRDQLKDKRISLIRLPTINSAARRRSTVWDSGENVSRPKGKGHLEGRFSYVRASQELGKKVLKIPQIRDGQRSEIQVDAKRAEAKRKVQFSRPRPDDDEADSVQKSHDMSKMGGESLNTTLADTTLDTSCGDVSLDEEIFRALAQKRLDDTRTTRLSSQDVTLISDQPGDQTLATVTTNTTATTQSQAVPPVNLRPLAKKNVMLHDKLQSALRTSPGGGRVQKASTGRSSPGIKSLKSSDRSVGTLNTLGTLGTLNSKISRLSQETEEWKSQYMRFPDPEKRNKTLSEIMFAVRTRMRDNEESLRFGETPRPSDQSYFEYLPTKVTPRWGAGQSQHATGGITARSNNKKGKGPHFHTKRRGLPGILAPIAPVQRKQQVQIQSYLNKMHRQRRNIDRMAGEPHRMANFAGQRSLQMVAQEA